MPYNQIKKSTIIRLAIMCIIGGLIWSITFKETFSERIAPEKLVDKLGELEHILPRTLAPRAAPPAQTRVTVETQGDVITQTFTLNSGWNTIYLEVEPINPSPLVNRGTTEEPLMVPISTTIEALLGNLSGLETVWGWYIPPAPSGQIVNPTQGLGSEAGWRRYIHPSVVDSNGNSQAHLTDLVNLHANRGYLIKLADNAPTSTLTIAGTPTMRRQRGRNDAYQLVGFPLLPSATPTVANFTAGSSITEVHALSSAGQWQQLPNTDTLSYGQAYLVKYGGSAADTANFTAPLALITSLPNGLSFTAGTQGRAQTLRIQNFASQNATVAVKLLQGNNVALRMTSPSTRDLKTQTATVSLQGKGQAGDTRDLRFTVRSVDQTTDSSGLLEISSTALGVRWLIPVTARSGSQAGLWIGDVTVNDVSESRLGSTNVANGNLTVGLRSQNNSGISGSVQMREIVSGTSASVTLSVTVNLLTLESAPVQPLSGTPPYVTGYVFVDRNQNGQRDGDEPGLPNRTVTLGGQTATTGADGSYLFQNPSVGTATIRANIPAGFSSNFPLTLPANYFTQEETPQYVVITPDTNLATTSGVTTTSPNGLFRVSMNQSDEIAITHTSTGVVVWKSPATVSNVNSANALWQSIKIRHCSSIVASLIWPRLILT